MLSRSSIRRHLPWAAALRDMKRDRAERAMVREEPIRIGGASGIRLSAWRGMSGRRYVVMVHPIADAATLEAPGLVILGVRRDPDGRSCLLGAGHAGTVTEAAELAGADGANELHLHRLAADAAERDAIVADLMDFDDAPADPDTRA